MNRYRLHEPKSDVIVKGTKILFDDGGSMTEGVVVSYADDKYTILVHSKHWLFPSFHYNVRRVYRLTDPSATGQILGF